MLDCDSIVINDDARRPENIRESCGVMVPAKETVVQGERLDLVVACLSEKTDARVANESHGTSVLEIQQRLRSCSRNASTRAAICSV